MRPHLLLLGGTTEARALALRLAARTDLTVTLSLAGRTLNPAAMPVPVRSGGFGGAEGLEAYLRAHGVTALLDATHPYAARISANAALAARRAGVPLLVLHRLAWVAEPGDDWRPVADVAAACAALGHAPRRVFLALGRQEVAGFAAAPQHRYLIRSVDPITPPPPMPRVTCLTARGPFTLADEEALLDAHGIEAIVCKNSGGAASFAKLVAARARRLPVFLLDRPALPEAPRVATVESALDWLDHVLSRRAV
ncbi:cobalt-precorrin-6A reductase [Falsiroseomonas sp.]|uniref:cobalt-precorrin-6A reductase n=1 Tax=Falsiroseomonas sp. TaxID=2870721 RepID=UPI002724C1D9|nr:cobalt-precorrin-6A reductase [Falsiroseomonas sp.]MDO9498710.1 cobalt-precorrin-6A reductase [Falsiroseomonas sp.]